MEARDPDKRGLCELMQMEVLYDAWNKDIKTKFIDKWNTDYLWQAQKMESEVLFYII